jgi:hypothetical protein
MGNKKQEVKSESKQELDPAAKAAMQKALAAADSIYSSRDPSGMSPEMKAALADSTNYYKSDAFRQPNQNMVNIGQGLLGGGMATNPFNNGRELGDGSGMAQILALMSKRQPRPEGGGGYGGGQGMQGGGQGMRPRMQGMGGGLPQGYSPLPQSMMAQGQPQGQFSPNQSLSSTPQAGNPQAGMYGLLPQTAVEPPSQPFIPQAQPQAQPDAFAEWQKNQQRYMAQMNQQNPYSGG